MTVIRSGGALHLNPSLTGEGIKELMGSGGVSSGFYIEEVCNYGGFRMACNVVFQLQPTVSGNWNIPLS